jgi:hydroxymethylglutaryl-CoA lyase
VTVTEVGSRDGFQIEREFIPTATKIADQPAGDAGLPIIEFSRSCRRAPLPLVDAAEALAGLDRSGHEFAALVPRQGPRAPPRPGRRDPRSSPPRDP